MDYLEELSLFVALYSGGVDGVFLKDLASFHGQFVDPKKSIIFGEFWPALAVWDVDTPHVQDCIVEDAVHEQQSQQIQGAHACELVGFGEDGKRQQDLLDGEKLLCELRAAFKGGRSGQFAIELARQARQAPRTVGLYGGSLHVWQAGAVGSEARVIVAGQVACARDSFDD